MIIEAEDGPSISNVAKIFSFQAIHALALWATIMYAECGWAIVETATALLRNIATVTIPFLEITTLFYSRPGGSGKNSDRWRPSSSLIFYADYKTIRVKDTSALRDDKS